MILDRFVLKMAYLGLLVPTTNPDAINKLFASKHYNYNTYFKNMRNKWTIDNLLQNVCEKDEL